MNNEMLNSLIYYLLNEFDRYEIVCIVHPDNKPSKVIFKS